MRPVGIYIARFRNTRNQPASKSFLRGYGYEGYSNVDFNWRALGDDGGSVSERRRCVSHNVTLSITGYVEVLPRWDNFVEIDRTVKDTYGIPVLKIQMSNWPENKEQQCFKDIGESAVEMLEAAGATNIQMHKPRAVPYWAAHEAGMARMGNDPKKSVLNQFQQAHDVKNLFVMDASSFTSNPCQNPTLTIMALCVRSCDYLMDELKRGEIQI